MRKVLMLLSVALSVGSLASCGQTRAERIKPPSDRLTCAAEPVPAGDTDKAVAQFIVDLVAAGQDCRDAVVWLRDWSEGE